MIEQAKYVLAKYVRIGDIIRYGDNVYEVTHIWYRGKKRLFSCKGLQGYASFGTYDGVVVGSASDGGRVRFLSLIEFS